MAYPYPRLRTLSFYNFNAISLTIGYRFLQQTVPVSEIRVDDGEKGLEGVFDWTSMGWW